MRVKNPVISNCFLGVNGHYIYMQRLSSTVDGSNLPHLYTVQNFMYHRSYNLVRDVLEGSRGLYHWLA